MTKAQFKNVTADPGFSEEALKSSEVLKSYKKGVEALYPILDIVGNKKRLQVLILLHEQQNLCVTDICNALGMSAPALSQHLRKMREAKVVTTRKKHKTVFYSLQKKQEGVLNEIFKLLKERS